MMINKLPVAKSISTLIVTGYEKSCAARGILLAVLSFKDVVHERLMSFCLIVALAGMIAPLLVLFGLKHGVIHKIQSELIQDPVNRELRPAETKQYLPAFFSEVRAMPEVSFIVESVTEGASVIRAEAPDGVSRLADMLPTASGDPLLLENATPVPDENQVVLSAKLAETLGVVVRNKVTLSAQRTDSGDISRVEAQFEVVAVLPLRADVLERAYVPMNFAVDIESFREGFSVDSREWPGRGRDVAPAYQAVVFTLDRNLSASEKNSLLINTDFFQLNSLSKRDIASKLGLQAVENQHWFEVTVIDKLAGGTSLQRVSRRLKNIGATFWPWNPPLDGQLSLDASKGEWLSVEVRSQAETGVTPDGSAAELNGDEEVETIALNTLVISREEAAGFGLHGTSASPIHATLKVEVGHKLIVLPVLLAIDLQVNETRTDGSANESVAGESLPAVRMNASLLGQLSLGRQVPLTFNKKLGVVERESLGARGFRLFADNIYNVAIVRDKLQSLQVPTLSSLQAIIRLQTLDKGLTNLFVLIAIAGVATSVIVLVANQIGSVQRKRDSLAQVRLLGLSKAEVSLLPLLTGTYLSLAGGLLGVGIALITAWMINRFYATSLGFGKSVCVILVSHAFLSLVLVLGLTAMTSIFAAVWTTRVDPAEGMRHE